MNKYLEILNLFVSSDNFRPGMCVPNIGDVWVSATDAVSLVFFKKELLPINTNFETLGKYPDINKFTSMHQVQNDTLDIDKIKSIISKCPLIEDYDEEGKEDICSECGGSRYVEFEYEANKSTYYMNGECPICMGIGRTEQTIKTPNGKMVPNNEYYLQMGISFLSIYLVERLLKIQELIGDTIQIINHQEAHNAILFKIGEVKIIIMPLLKNEKSNYLLGNIA